MSASGVILLEPTANTNSNVLTDEEKPEFPKLEEEIKDTGEDQENTACKSPAISKPKNLISYTKDELLDLRSAPLSLKKPECLSEEFFVRNGVWDPIAWHQSAISRSSSPAVDGKCVTFEHGKKIELFEDTIELAPQRRSFCQGCHVQSPSEQESMEKGGLIKRLRASSSNDMKGTTIEGRDRLTGRATSQRKNIEKAILKDRENKQNNDNKKTIKGIQDVRNIENYEDSKERKREYINTKNNKSYLEKERNERQKNKAFEKENRNSGRERNHSGYDNWETDANVQRRRNSNGLPEWMTDGPISQNDFIELKGFNKEIEAERKALKDTKNPTSNSSTPKQQQPQQQKQQQQRSRKSSKGSSRSSTPGEKKHIMNKTEENKKRINERNSSESDNIGNVKRSTPSDKMFDENGYFDMMDYLPTHLFNDDYAGESAAHSKFSRWFQNQSASSSDRSRPNSGPLGLGRSPTPPVQYFTPIQPAPATQVFEQPIPVSPLMDMFTSSKQMPIAKPKEVKGRVTVDEIEQEFPKPIGYKPPKAKSKQTAKTMEQNAFDKLVFTMKAAGQLPEKPAPVVSGLPEHLLPKPPKRTSPSFEKLKRALSRSPSPIHSGRMSPLNFINRPASPLITPISERLLSPEFFHQNARSRPINSNSLFGGFPENQHPLAGSHMSSRIAQQQQQHPEHNRRFENGFMTPDNFAAQKQPQQQQQSKMPTAFLPTSVIKKMHSEKQDVKERTDSFPKFDISSARLGHPPGLQTHHTQGTEASPSYSSHGKNGPMADRSNNDQNHIISSKMIDSLLADKDDGTDDVLASKLPPTSAPNSPRARPRDNEDLKLYHSAPVTPLHADINLPKNLPPAQQNRVAEPVSAFSRPIDAFGMVGKINNEITKDHSYNPHQNTEQRFANRPDSLLGSSQANYRDLININRGANDPRLKNAGAVSQTKGSLIPPFLQNENKRMNMPNPQPRISHSQQQMQRPSQSNQFNQFHHRGANPPNGPKLPVPMNQPLLNPNPLTSNMNARPNIPAVTAAMAAQIVQQQLLQQAARAHAIQTAQAIQQQQQQNLLRSQMQAAMAQAYAREQAKAMMYPRAVANNLQAVAQQMGLRAPHPGNQRKVPTPLLNQAKANAPSDVEGKAGEASEKPKTTKESPLSKWFNVDAIQKTPPVAQVDPAAISKVISLEDLERSQR